jgi:MFS family permease
MRARAVARGLVLAGGLALLGFGVAGFLAEPYLDGQRWSVLFWGAGAIALHDGVWVPVLLLVGAVVARRVPARVRGPVVVGLITAAALTAVGLPAVLREGQHNGNATLLPLAYLRNWLLLLAAVAVAVGCAIGAGILRNRLGRRR